MEKNPYRKETTEELLAIINQPPPAPLPSDWPVWRGLIIALMSVIAIAGSFIYIINYFISKL